MAKRYNTEECLKSFLDLFDEGTFSEEEKELLNANRSEVFFKKDEILTKQGSLATQIIFINQGLTKSYFEFGNTKQMICLHPIHSLLGIQGLSDSNIYHCTVAALDDVAVCMFAIETFKEIAKKNAAFVFQLLNINIELNSTSIDRIFSIKLKDNASKIADVLLCLSQRVYRAIEFVFPFSIEEIADLTDMPIEVAQKIWNHFQKEGLFKFTEGKMCILNKERLLDISDEI